MELPSQQQSDQDAQTDLKKKQEKFQQDPNSYNGAIRENYTWTQTIKDIDVRVKVSFAMRSSNSTRISHSFFAPRRLARTPKQAKMSKSKSRSNH